MSDDILETLKCGRPEYNEETRNYETVVTKNERLAIKEITRLRGEVERLTTLCNLVEAQTLNYAAERDAALARAEAAERERDEALPWQMFYGKNKTLGEIAEHYGKSIYDFSPWLTAPMSRAIAEAVTKNYERATTAEAKVAKLREALTPFADIGEWSENVFDPSMASIDVALGDLRRARTALQETEQ